MPSLRKRVSSYFRQLSFHNEPRDKRHNINENSFVTKYLQGQIQIREGPAIIYGKNPTDLPNYEVKAYENGQGSTVGCYSGPHGGLTTVKRQEKHLSVLDADIDFIDTQDQEESVRQPAVLPRKSPQKPPGQPIDNTTMIIKMAGNEYCVTNRPKKSHSKSHSLGSISDFRIEIETTKIDKSYAPPAPPNNNSPTVPCKNNCSNGDCDVVVRKKEATIPPRSGRKPVRRVELAKTEGFGLAKSKSEGNPFQHRKGKIIKIAQRPTSSRANDEQTSNRSEQSNIPVDDSLLPVEWNKKSDFFYGLSDSLYDRHQVTKNKNGDPIADCFGIITRGDSAILAVADGVNWGEKASVAAKSAVHGCLHYLNKTIFHDTKPFENLTIKSEDSTNIQSTNSNLIGNTRDVFVCLLRAFNCAHDLILENHGMLTTLTVAVILPIKPKGTNTDFVCCVCNVGDTLAYVYSKKFGVRELTKGSHDIHCNRDMRDALGALGPVDGINPELSNLTLSITTLEKGDIILVASDGLTDNFDPNVCKFTVNSKKITKKPPPEEPVVTVAVNKPPVKPPRRSKQLKDDAAETSSKSSSVSEQSIEKPAALETHFDECDNNPLVKEFMRQNSVESARAVVGGTGSLEAVRKVTVVENKASSLRRQASSQHRQPPEPALHSSHQRPSSHLQKSTSSKAVPKPAPPKHPSTGYKFLRSKTALDFLPTATPQAILRNDDGIPYVTPYQRYELQLLLMEDVLKNGISGKETPCTTARKLCENLLNFTVSITAAKRHTLEDQDLYFDNRDGVLVELSQQEKKVRRKRGLERVQNLPGKLDHVTVVAWNVGNCV